MSVSFSVNPSVMSLPPPCAHVYAQMLVCVPVHVHTGIVCVYVCVFIECRWYGMQVCTCMCVCMDCHRIQDHRLPPSDLTQPWTLLPLRSIRIIYPTPSLSSRLMHGGVKHLVMLNHSGAQHARSHPEWQHRAREGAGWGKKYHIALRERKRGRWRGREGWGARGVWKPGEEGEGSRGTSGG